MSNFTQEEVNAILKEEVKAEERLKIPPVQMDAFAKPLPPPCRMYPDAPPPVCVKPVVLADSKAVMLAYLEIQGVKVHQPKCRKDDRGWLAWA